MLVEYEAALFSSAPCWAVKVSYSTHQSNRLYVKICIFNDVLNRVRTVKPLKFVDSSQKDLRAMPAEVRRALGLELMTVQFGGEPNDFKPLKEVGVGAFEIRHRDRHGAFRVIYVAKFADALYVLHAFQKKTQKTSKADLDLAAKRYKLIGG